MNITDKVPIILINQNITGTLYIVIHVLKWSPSEQLCAANTENIKTETKQNALTILFRRRFQISQI